MPLTNDEIKKIQENERNSSFADKMNSGLSQTGNFDLSQCTLPEGLTRDNNGKIISKTDVK